MDKILIKSEYDEKLHRRFYLFHMFRKSFSVYFLLLAIVLALYLAVKATMNYSEETSMTNLYIAWGFAALIIGTVPTFTFGRVNAIIRQNKKERGDRLEFIEITKAKIVRFIEGIEGKAVLGWEHFESVYETEKCFYLYIDKERGLVIDKNDIVEGSVEALRKLVQNNLKPNQRGKIKFKQLFKAK
ncbi:MAG: YcxB family protein [Bacilli bacterium]|nr:YcxB family protein [Bacilli bacterium]MDD4076381.1 YcxB family protein [Bacilli bacterium]MDD4389073.1 YcxB family protein [Bacilli bacterium]